MAKLDCSVASRSTEVNFFFQARTVLNVAVSYRPADRDVSIHKLLLGTHTSSTDPNYLMVADVRTVLLGNISNIHL
jgi:hypothetical protein